MCCDSKVDIFCKVSIVILILLMIVFIFINIFFNNTQNRDILVAIARTGDNTEVGNANNKI